jgi:glycosyltransferase involved in cell wall biosynthesis
MQTRRWLPTKHEAAGEVAYKNYRQFFADCFSNRWDVLLSFRSFDPFLLGRIAPRMIFWTGDASDQPALKDFEHPALQRNIDLIFCVSKWHRDSFIERFGLPAAKVVATRNGFCPEIVPEPAYRDWTRGIYSSTPFRGLEILLRMFPHMRQRIPTLRLDVFSSMKVYGWSSEADQKAYGAIYKAAEQPGVSWHGSVPQPRLMESLSTCGLFLYPNTFAETSCMAVIEAQACGAVVITTARAGLNETVENGKSGICLPGEPGHRPLSARIHYNNDQSSPKPFAFEGDLGLCPGSAHCVCIRGRRLRGSGSQPLKRCRVFRCMPGGMVR